MITKVLVSAAIALGAAVGVAAPAMADPSTEPSNPGVETLALGPVLGCADNGLCPTGPLSTLPTLNPEQVTVAMKNSLSGLDDYADMQGIPGR